MTVQTTQARAVKLTGGFDGGNGYVKAKLRGEVNGVEAVDLVDLPSVVSAENRSMPKVPLDDATAAEVLADPDFYNRIECSIQSPLVSRGDLKTFGRKALTTPGKLTQFEVFGSHSKADQELSFILVLGVFAAKVLRDHVAEHGALPTHELQASVRAGLALPIAEYVQRRHGFAADFTGPAPAASTHLVTLKTFSTPVVVRLTFEAVHVLAEGASAQFAITNKGEALAQALLDDLRQRDPEGYARLTEQEIGAADLVAVQNTIGVDVGEGTTNFPVYSDGRFNPAASSTLDQGFGTVLENAIEAMREARPQLSFGSRKELADFLQQEPSKFTRGKHGRAQGFVDDQAEYLCEEIASAFGDVLTQAGSSTDVVYVYGGGSGPIAKFLRPKLQQIAGDIPVLYLDARYSRHLNREGLFIAARHVEQHDQSAMPAGNRQI
ncbi:hypothetical protein [Arthrobacter bambusae]|uniref:Actin-like protein N-terminal domain-containing protein n=1 Tax=Arthrobacter bambusae TaxID=1338426 RepID=A0AAW8D8W5_9MICC|nr:hypothetical protein [Arthrobacter bambusae]MDP9904717.1 hypothetical protein [Arthrobacter bambusae]MDQ0129533.1 hypothetical protein [Arthrobacter bambusae]MDQ0180854.1 hypothetical protein [Arthrobacter bambusae]